jgi:hypothetical protein
VLPRAALARRRTRECDESSERPFRRCAHLSRERPLAAFSFRCPGSCRAIRRSSAPSAGPSRSPGRRPSWARTRPPPAATRARAPYTRARRASPSPEPLRPAPRQDRQPGGRGCACSSTARFRGRLLARTGARWRAETSMTVQTTTPPAVAGGGATGAAIVTLYAAAFVQGGGRFGLDIRPVTRIDSVGTGGLNLLSARDGSVHPPDHRLRRPCSGPCLTSRGSPVSASATSTMRAFAPRSAPLPGM